MESDGCKMCGLGVSGYPLRQSPEAKRHGLCEGCQLKNSTTHAEEVFVGGEVHRYASAETTIGNWISYRVTASGDVGYRVMGYSVNYA